MPGKAISMVRVPVLSWRAGGLRMPFHRTRLEDSMDTMASWNRPGYHVNMKPFLDLGVSAAHPQLGKRVVSVASLTLPGHRQAADPM